ncbi:hypothetical protein GCM10009775_36670 [Microbacterium aoyamense]|uniref:Uncharacterized protein n=1 Tax=Microbacterium aoyamense TaxID=344166 RepID=A0ABP5BF76_9MICO|nr:hypothetical protein [Microbacterium aoyamense]
MIAVYAQSSQRQGLDASINGSAVTIENPEFASLRDKSAAVRLRAKRVRSGDVEVQFGQGLLRLEFAGAELDGSIRSPIVAVVDERELMSPIAAVAQLVVEGVEAVDRRCDVSALNAALAVGRELARARKKTQATWWISVAAIIGVLLVTAVAYVRPAPRRSNNTPDRRGAS